MRWLSQGKSAPDAKYEQEVLLAVDRFDELVLTASCKKGVVEEENWFDEWSDESFTDKFLVWLPKEARNILRKSSMFEDHFQENQSKLLEIFHQSSDLDQHLSLKYLIQITCIWIAISNQLLRLFFTCLQRKISQKTFAWLSSPGVILLRMRASSRPTRWKVF